MLNNNKRISVLTAAKTAYKLSFINHAKANVM